MKRENYSYKLNVLHSFTNFILLENQWDRVKFLGTEVNPKSWTTFIEKLTLAKHQGLLKKRLEVLPKTP